jgi:SAM-dependent methyltransferase
MKIWAFARKYLSCLVILSQAATVFASYNGNQLFLESSGFTLDFTNGVGQQHLISGWSIPEPGHTWSDSNRARIKFRIPESLPVKNLDLIIGGGAFLFGSHIKQEVRVIVNKELVSNLIFDVNNNSEHSVCLYSGLAYGFERWLDILFEFNNPMAPVEVGLNSDTRRLGLALQSLTIKPSTSVVEGPFKRIVTQGDGSQAKCYQPIFGHPELSTEVSRLCEDRLVKIRDLYKSLECNYQRPLRVLDLGCAQGYFCFHLAELGATVTGLDYWDLNIGLCNKIYDEHPALKVNFIEGKIEDFLDKLDQDQYDLVLGLSVFHHLIPIHGLEYVQKMLHRAAGKISAGIFELALKAEPLYWAVSLPENHMAILSGFAFTHTVSEHNTHLSHISRPLIFASNQFRFLDGNLEKCDSK